MATKTWQNGGVNNNYSTAGNWAEGSKPAAGDDVVIAANYDMVIDEGTANLQSWDMTGYAGTMSGSFGIVIAPGAGVTSTVKFEGTITWAAALTLTPNATATINFTSGGASTFTAITLQGAGTYNFLDNLTIGTTRVLTLTSGTLHADGAADNSGLTHSWGKFSSSNSTSRTLYLGTATINITGVVSSVSWDTNTTTNMTLNAGTSLINFTHNGFHQTNFGNGLTYYDISATTPGGTAWELNGTTSTFNNFTITGAASKATSFSIYNGNLTVNSFTANGNSAVNRLLIRTQTSGSPGTSRSIIAGTVSFSNVDFRDIAGAGAANWDLSAITGGSGNCGGCSGITFTTATTQTWSGATGNWSDITKWTSRVPLPQDDVIIPNGTGTITSDMTRLGKDITFQGSATWTRGVAAVSYGDWTLHSSVNVTNAPTIAHTIESIDRSGTQTVTMAGKGFNGGLNILAVGATIQSLDAMSIGSAILTITFGNFTTDSSLFAQRVNISGTGTINMGSSTWTVTGSFGTTVWSVATTNTLNAESSTIRINKSSPTGNSVFSGGGKTYNNLIIEADPDGDVTQRVIIQSSNTFNQITVTGLTSIQLTSSTTQTVSDFVTNGPGIIYLTASTAGTAATLAKSGSGTLDLDYLNITDTNVTPLNTWYYGPNSTYNSGTGWNPRPTSTPLYELSKSSLSRMSGMRSRGVA